MIELRFKMLLSEQELEDINSSLAPKMAWLPGDFEAYEKRAANLRKRIKRALLKFELRNQWDRIAGGTQ